MVVGGALAWSVGTVVASRSVRGSADPLALAGWQMAVGGVVLGCAGALADEAAPAAGWREAGLILGLGVIGSAAPLALFYLALTRAPASEVSAWFFLIPVIGVASAWPLLGEEPTLRLLIGWRACRSGSGSSWPGAAPARGRLVDSPAPP